MAFNETVIDRLVTYLVFREDGVDMDAMERRLNRISGGMDRLGNRFLAAGAAMTAASFVPVSKFAEWERQLSLLAGHVDIGEQEMTVDIMPRLLGLSNQFGKPVEELTAALKALMDMGYSTEEAFRSMDVQLRTSMAGMGDALDLSWFETGVRTTFGIDDPNRIFGTLASGFAKMKRDNANALASAIGMVGPSAAQFEVSFEEVVGTLAAMDAADVPVMEAATRIESFLASLINRTDQGKEALESVGTSFEDMEASIREVGMLDTIKHLNMLFGGDVEKWKDVLGRLEGTRMVQLLTGPTGDELREAIKSIDPVEGMSIIDRTVDRVDDDIIKEWERLTERFDNKLIEQGARLQDYGRDWIGLGNRVIDSYENSSEATKGWIDFGLTSGPLLIGLGIALKAVAFALGPFVSGILWAGRSIMTILPFIGALARVVFGLPGLLLAAGYLIFQNWESIKGYFSDGIEKLLVDWAGLAHSLTGVQSWEDLKAWFDDFGKALHDIWMFWLDAIKSAALGIWEGAGLDRLAEWIVDRGNAAGLDQLGDADNQPSFIEAERARGAANAANPPPTAEFSWWRYLFTGAGRSEETALPGTSDDPLNPNRQAQIDPVTGELLAPPPVAVELFPPLPVGPAPDLASGSGAGGGEVRVEVGDVTINAQGASAEEVYREGAQALRDEIGKVMTGTDSPVRR